MSSKQCLNVVWFVVCFILAPFSLAHASGLEAGSWGGKVRAGPGKNYDQIGSLQNGDPVVLLKRFDVASSDYPGLMNLQRKAGGISVWHYPMRFGSSY